MLPICPPAPFDPLLVATTLGSAPALVALVATVVVEYVCVGYAVADDETKETSASPGAGTVMVQVFEDVLHATLWTLSVPCKRPSEANWSPRVYPIHQRQLPSDQSVKFGDALAQPK